MRRREFIALWCGAAAEEFVREDPFILEGVVKPFKIRDWKDSMLPG
jgi:hypothetical protein